MSDTRITIGGKLPKDKLDEFVVVVDSEWDRVTSLYDDEALQEAKDAALAAVENRASLVLYGDDDNEFRTLRGVCRSVGLTFVFLAGPDEASEGYTICWMPGWKTSRTTIATSDGEPLIRLSELEAALDANNTLFCVVYEMRQRMIEVPPLELGE